MRKGWLSLAVIGVCGVAALACGGDSTADLLTPDQAVQEVVPTPVVPEPPPAASATLVGWTDFTSDSGRFSVKMPSTPQETVQPTPVPGMGSIDTHMFMSLSGNDAYMIGYADYPNEMMGIVPAAEVLKGAQDGAVANTGGSILDQQALTVGGREARQVKTTVPAMPGGVMVSRFFLVNNRMYMAVGVFSSEPSQETVNGWLDSFVVP